jgi:hypothetical protein
MPVMPDTPVFAARAHDQAHARAGDRGLSKGVEAFHPLELALFAFGEFKGEGVVYLGEPSVDKLLHPAQIYVRSASFRRSFLAVVKAQCR